MGVCNCSLDKSNNTDATFDPERLGYLGNKLFKYFKAKSFKYNIKLMSLLIRIQSKVRGIIARNNIRIKAAKGNSIKLFYDSDNDYGNENDQGGEQNKNKDSDMQVKRQK